MDEFEDLESFIANIEQSAPQEELDDGRHRCQECDTFLEDIDGTFICPNCSAQATNILQLEETEMLYDESGRAILGQRVNLFQRKPKHIDYGWAWSTDEAIVHILCEQLKAIERIGLVPRLFLEGTKNMWIKFWVENVAPHIKDEYHEEDLVQVEGFKSLKTRDIEVLIKVQDKVMIPKRNVNKVEGTRKFYNMLNTKFTRHQTEEEDSDDEEEEEEEEEDEGESPDPANRSLQITPAESDQEKLDDISLTEKNIDTVADLLANENVGLTRTLSRSSVSILTLNRTLAFIEATARCMKLPKPIFASDLIRGCNQRSIPFFGANKILPEGIKLNHKDKALFQKTRPPSPNQLTRTAIMLIHRVYRNELPFHLPVPDLHQILERFIEDMNLPFALLGIFEGISFDRFKRTRPIRMCDTGNRFLNPPQYDRWAFAILVVRMKKYYNLDDPSICAQAEQAKKESSDNSETYFVLQDWIKQMSMRLQLVLSYDPFIIFHPITDINMLEPNPQIYKYVECVLTDRVLATTRTTKSVPHKDENYRNELTDFLIRELPVPTHLQLPEEDSKELDKPADIWHPLQDSIMRTKKFWISEVSENQKLHDLLFKDFAHDEVSPLKDVKVWKIFDGTCERRKRHEIKPEWPYCFKLLLSVGAFLCYCEPRDLLVEIRQVERFFYPKPKKPKKKKVRISVH